ncbi:MAG: Gmad2 immunoglobulin-like domain-containing protein [Actinomycetota bacterium]
MSVQRSMPRPLVALVVVLAVATAGCSSSSTSPPEPSGSSTAVEPPSTLSPSPTPGESLTVQIWLTREGKLFVTTRTIEKTGAVGTATLNALLAGPTAGEAATGVRTAIPDGTKLEGLDIDVAFAHPRFSTHVESDPLSDAQVVYTLTQFPTVERVQINDQEGGPLSRADLQRELPAILVESPSFGTRVSSPVTVSGTADVFEATVSIRIIDQDDNVVGHAFTTATCGTGCRGNYDKAVSYSVDADQPGFVMVFEESAENGLPINVVKIPVTLIA